MWISGCTTQERQRETSSDAGASKYCRADASSSREGKEPAKGDDERIDRRVRYVHSNFVFGETLGSGSFATVKHAWLIVRGKPRSSWPEYAIKSIDAKFERVALREAKVMEQLAGIVPLTGHDSEEAGDDSSGVGPTARQLCGSKHRHLTRLACPLFKSRRGAPSGDGLCSLWDLRQVVQSSRQQNQAGLGSSPNATSAAARPRRVNGGTCHS